MGSRAVIGLASGLRSLVASITLTQERERGTARIGESIALAFV